MKLKNYILIILSIFMINNCTQDLVGKNSFTNVNYDVLELDAVSKLIVFDNTISSSLKTKLDFWFNNYVKINGFEGDAILTISNYNEKIINSNDSKKVELNFNYNLTINQSNKNQKTFYKGDVSSYHLISGNFSLSEFDNIFSLTEDDTIIRLIKSLNDN